MAKKPSSPRIARVVAAHAISIGFVPLIDAAPVIAAFELGYFQQEDLAVRLERQIGWGNVRDRLTYGQLHASHLPLGMAAASVAGLPSYDEPLVALMGLALGGNAITISRGLTDVATNALAPAAWRRHLGRPLNLAYVNSTASHYVCLREFMHKNDLQNGRDVSLCVLPPPQMPELLAAGTIDGYCAGEPWNTLAEVHGWGSIVAASTQLFPDHPEKVLAVTHKWYVQNPQTAQRLIRAVLRGCDFCANTRNHRQLAEMLAQPAYIDLESKVIERSLKIDERMPVTNDRPRFRTFDRESARLSPEPVARLFRQMLNWGALPPDMDVQHLAREVMALDAFDQAALSSTTNPRTRATA